MNFRDHAATRLHLLLLSIAGSCFLAAEWFIRLDGFLAVIAFMTFGTVCSLYFRDVRVSPPEVRRIRRERRPTELALHLRTEPLISRLIGVITLSLSFAGAALVFHLIEPEKARWIWVAAGLFLLLGPDAIRGLRREPELVLSREGLTYHGWGVDASAAWSDIRFAYALNLHGPASVVHVRTVGQPATLRYRRRFLVFPMEPALKKDGDARGLEIPFAALEDPVAVTELIRTIADPFKLDALSTIDTWLYCVEHYPADTAMKTFADEMDAQRKGLWR